MLNVKIFPQVTQVPNYLLSVFLTVIWQRRRLLCLQPAFARLKSRTLLLNLLTESEVCWKCAFPFHSNNIKQVSHKVLAFSYYMYVVSSASKVNTSDIFYPIFIKKN